MKTKKSPWFTTNARKLKILGGLKSISSYSCDICDFHTRRLGVYIFHLKSKRHSDNDINHRPVNANDYKYKCPECRQPDVETNFTSVFVEHLYVHLSALRLKESKKFQCSFCHYRATVQSYSSAEHMEIHNGKKPFVCHYCPFEAVRSSALKFHVEVHHKNNTYQCRFCKFTSRFGNYMKIHERTHGGDRKFKCIMCGYQAKKIDHFDRHQKMHGRDHAGQNATGDGKPKEYFCDKCEISLPANPKNIEDHEKLHFYERQFNLDPDKSSCSGSENPALFGCKWTASTWIGQETCAFLWTIRNFSSVIKEDEVKSSCFRGGNRAHHLWQLELSRTLNGDGNEYFGVRVILCKIGGSNQTNNSNHRVRARFQISLLDRDGICRKQYGGPSMGVLEFKAQTVWGMDELIKMTELTDPGNNFVADDDTVRVHCRVWVDDRVRQTADPFGMANEYKSEEQLKLRRLELLSKDMKGVRDSTLYTDFALVTQNNTYLVHKSVLAARSPVLQLQMMKVDDNTIDLHGFDEETVEAMLDYMYSGHTDALQKKARDLIVIADKFELSGLKEECEDALALSLTVENAAEYLMLAHRQTAFKMTPKVIDFIQRNMEQVRLTDSFSELAQANEAVFAYLLG